MTSTARQPDVVRRRVVVHGRVHGVGFRVGCARRAVAAGLTGWVTNRPDGTVEAIFEGPRDVVDELVAWCHTGPSMAKVSNVDTYDEPPAHDRSFAIR